MKTCTICKTEKPLKEFNKKLRSKDGKQPQCRDCGKERSRSYYYKNSKKHISATVRRNRKVRNAYRQLILDYLRTHSCIDCGESDPIVLDFDHVNGNKRCDVSRLIYNGTEKQIMNEIAKCVVRCANCHRRRTAKEHGHFRFANARS